jgi:hypothetical protein
VVNAKFINRIFNSSTSANELVWSDSFRTQELLEEIINNKLKITSPLIAAKVGWFFWKFASTDEARKTATTNEVYDAIINHSAKHTTTAESVQRVALAIGNITANNPDGQRLFTTLETLLPLVDALEKFQDKANFFFYVGYALFSCGFSEHQKKSTT